MRIVLSGGGTGGHATPIIALSTALRQLAPSTELHYIGSGNQLEQTLAKSTGLTYYAISSGKYRRYGRGVGEVTDVSTAFKNTKDGISFIKGIAQARSLLKKINPSVVFVKGGYVGLPVGLAARSLHIPLIIHESDVIMGLTNRILSRSARVIATGFPAEAYHEKLASKLTFVGNLVRDEFYHRSSSLKYHTKRPIIVILGGSSGARHINQVIWEALPGLINQYHVIHQTGDHSIAEAEQIQAKLTPLLRQHYQPVAFIATNIAPTMESAEVIVSRAGANAIAELAALKKPSILIPLANSANNHQAANAAFVAHQGAARVILEPDLTPQAINQTIDSLMKHSRDRHELSRAIGRLATPSAANSLADIIIHQAQGIES